MRAGGSDRFGHAGSRERRESVAIDAGTRHVVDHNVQRPVRNLHRRFGRPEGGDVLGDGHAIQLLRERVGNAGVVLVSTNVHTSVRNHERDAPLRKCLRDCATDAARGARHERDPPREAEPCASHTIAFFCESGSVAL